MRTTNKTISGLTFHGTTIRTRISWLIDLLGEPAGGSGYGRTAMGWGRRRIRAGFSASSRKPARNCTVAGTGSCSRSSPRIGRRR